MNAIGAAPAHVPSVPTSVWPSVVVPEIVGRRGVLGRGAGDDDGGDGGGRIGDAAGVGRGLDDAHGLADVGRGQDVGRRRGARRAVDVGAGGAGVAAALPARRRRDVGGVAHVPVVAVSVSPDLAVPAIVGGAVVSGPPAPVALVLNAATATIGSGEHELRAGGHGGRAFIGGTSGSGIDRDGHTVAREMRAEASPATSGFRKGFFPPHSRDLQVNHGSATSAKLIAMGARLLPAIFLGGAAGGLARAALEQAWPADGHSWPWVTFAVNIAGTALLAYVVARLGGDAPSTSARCSASACAAR